MIPFVDVKHVLETFESHGLPMVMNDTLTAPDGYDPDSFAHIVPPNSDDSIPQGSNDSIVQGVCAFIQAAMAFGVPTVVNDEFGEEDANLYQEYFDAGNRAKKGKMKAIEPLAKL